MQKHPGNMGAKYRPVLLSVGDIADRLTIARIKHRMLTLCERIDAAESVMESLVNLSNAIDDILSSGWVEFDNLINELERTNQLLWDVEDACRDCCGATEEFLEKAHDVMSLNSKRSSIKAAINALIGDGSQLDEVKLYGKKTYTGPSNERRC